MAGSTRRQGKLMAPPHPPRKLRRYLEEEFFCERRDLSLKLHQCMTDYVNANALQNKTSQCHKCELGLEQRINYAKGRL
jgi:hypothetical protein